MTTSSVAQQHDPACPICEGEGSYLVNTGRADTSGFYPCDCENFSVQRFSYREITRRRDALLPPVTLATILPADPLAAHHEARRRWPLSHEGRTRGPGSV